MDKKIDNDLISQPIDTELDQQQEQHENELDRNITFDEIKSRRDERKAAFNLLYAIDRSSYQLSLSEAVMLFETGFHLTLPKESYALELVQGAIDHRDDLDEQIKPFLKNWKMERLGCCTLLILRMALWELQQKNAIPSVIINEAVELAKIFAEKDAYKFVNGLLDQICKKRGIKVERDEHKE